MVKIGVMGATGYTGLELTKILLRHPEADLRLFTSRHPESRPLKTVHPALADRLDATIDPQDIDRLIDETELVFSCLPHAASASSVKQLVDAGIRVVDFSADYRLRDLAVYEEWYNVKHPDPNRIGSIPYGLPELFREEIVDAALVANPGCYPTSAILPLAPLLRDELISPQGIVCDSKSGVTGAGRSPKLDFHYPECNESIAAYKVGAHRHNPEINQVLSMGIDQPADVLFVPHLVPMNQGILTTAYARPTSDARREDDYLQALTDFYQHEPFIRVSDQLPATRHVRDTNFCDITVRLSRGRLVVICCLDNLIKGASGAAVQNFNVMFGFPETTALL